MSRTPSAFGDVEDRAQYRAELAALIAAARNEMNDPCSPILARLACGDPEIGSEVRAYSLRNQVLVVLQADARGLSLREAATFPQWRERGRCVRKGQHGLRVIGYRDLPETDEEYAAETSRSGRPNPTLTVSVFSIDQTDADAGRPAPQRLRAGLAARLRAAGFEVVDDPALPDPIRIDHDTKTVLVRMDDLGPDALRAMSNALTALVKRASP
jgi:hypothetical protein